MAENPNITLFDNEICKMNDGKLFLETARLTSSYTTSCARLVCDIKSSRAKTRPQPDHLLRPCKVAKHHADACTTADLYHKVGGSSEPPEPPQRTGLFHYHYRYVPFTLFHVDRHLKRRSFSVALFPGLPRFRSSVYV